MPSVFIRLAGCPLRCKFCDTYYAANPKAGKKLSITQILKQVEKYPTKFVVITGGEPFVCPNLAKLCKSMKRKHITIETAGIKFIEGLKCDLMSISPKLSNAYLRKSDKDLYLKVDELAKLMKNYEYQLKFVIEKARDIKEVKQVLCGIDSPKGVSAKGSNRLRGNDTLDRSKVMLMPQARKPSEYLKRGQLCAKLCKKYGFAFSPRLQITLWGNKKGK